jgi:hypothetical protein
LFFETSLNLFEKKRVSTKVVISEVGVLLLAVSVLAEIIFGPDVPFFGSQVTENLITLLNTLGEQGIAALIIVFAVIFAYRKLLK